MCITEELQRISSAGRLLRNRALYKEIFDLAGKAFLKWAKTDKDDSDGETQDFVCYVFDAWDAVYAADDPKINHAKMLEQMPLCTFCQSGQGCT